MKTIAYLKSREFNNKQIETIQHSIKFDLNKEYELLTINEVKELQNACWHFKKPILIK